MVVQVVRGWEEPPLSQLPLSRYVYGPRAVLLQVTKSA